MRYQLIRNKKIFELPDSDIEICDTRDEINNFSVKEIMNLLVELKDTNYKNAGIYVDIYTVLKNLTEENNIPDHEIEVLYKQKLKDEGMFGKYLLKIK